VPDFTVTSVAGGGVPGTNPGGPSDTTLRPPSSLPLPLVEEECIERTARWMVAAIEWTPPPPPVVGSTIA
jgi:hypothetical protein